MTDREILIEPAYHKCPESGICDPCIFFILRDPDRGAAITFRLATGWGMPDDAFKAASPDCTHAYHQNGWPFRAAGEFSAGPVSFHFAAPIGHCQTAAPCDVLGDITECYGDVGFSMGDVAFDVLRTKGSDGLFEWMEESLYGFTADITKVD